MPKTYDRQTAKFLAIVSENMPALTDGVMQRWIERPKALQRTLRRALVEECVFEVWRTIMVGGVRSGLELEGALRNEFRLVDWAPYLLNQPTFSVELEEKEMHLVNVSVEELGFKKFASYRDIRERALEMGLSLCPAEIGPQLRRQYRFQEAGEWLIVASEPLTTSTELPVFFCVENQGRGRVLGTQTGDLNHHWYPVNRFVFVHPHTW